MSTATRFPDHFRFRLARTDEERTLAYQVRYDVFLRELNYRTFLREADTHQERDEYDTQALLCLVEHRRTGAIAGCMRLVVPCADAPHPLDRLPLEHHCAASLDHPQLRPDLFPREEICEVSRLAVPSYFRHRLGGADLSLEDARAQTYSEEETRTFSLVGVSLFLTATALVGLLERPHVFAMMEPRFARLLALSGLRFERVGALVDYQGPRAPYYIDQRQAVRSLVPGLRSLYETIEQELGEQYRAPVEARGRSALSR
ncbi:PEP-CTERM/exosortase system-associated acyltransferase [Litchfieldella xinjiangensis]|uniref:PEP-CTERM/exosortase system-associated acyltransferase n=1 Tax=Litchfieldella xinjiangensis TaxID=1166948 RepID=UPI0006933BCA|nr:PEP-CTERM/exosortase system-associated acyltransferase [Halomonas xinjiangensis]